MKNSKLISGTAMIILLATIAYGCGAPKDDNKGDDSSVVEAVKTEENKSDNKNTDELQTNNPTTDDKQSEPGKSEEQKTEELKAKSPIDVVLDAISKLNTEKAIDMTINSILKNKEGNEEKETTYSKVIFKDDNIEFSVQAKSEDGGSLSLYKDNYLYKLHTLEGNEKKSKFSIENNHAKMLWSSVSISENLNAIQRDDISSVNIESSDTSSVTYSVVLSDKDETEESAEKAGSKLIFVIGNNGNLLKFSSEMAMGDDALSGEVIINAVGDDVTAIELPSDADSYEEIQLPKYESLDDEDDEEDMEVDDNEKGA